MPDRTLDSAKYRVLLDGVPVPWPLFDSEQDAIAAVMMTGISGAEYKRWRVEEAPQS